VDSVWVRFHPLAGYGKNGTPVRYVGYMGTVRRVHGCGM
jgi:hypothetical protein